MWGRETLTIVVSRISKDHTEHYGQSDDPAVRIKLFAGGLDGRFGGSSGLRLALTVLNVPGRKHCCSTRTIGGKARRVCEHRRSTEEAPGNADNGRRADVREKLQQEGDPVKLRIKLRLRRRWPLVWPTAAMRWGLT
jgi:hypothetical protein